MSNSTDVSAEDPYPRETLSLDQTHLSYVDAGSGEAVVLLHGNPTSSYLWRNVIPHLEPRYRCLAPDLIGMGDSGRAPDGCYEFHDHAEYLDDWFEELGLMDESVHLVGHDWGAALGAHWGRRNPDAVASMTILEPVIYPFRWSTWEATPEVQEFFRALRSEEGEAMILEENAFVEEVLPGAILRALSEEEMNRYRKPYRDSRERRGVTMTWGREVPIEGEPADVQQTVEAFDEWLKSSSFPKLIVVTEPGLIMTGEILSFCRSLPGAQELVVPGLHYVQEDSPHRLGRGIRDFLEGL